MGEGDSHLKKSTECQVVNVERLKLENHHFATMIVKTGLGKTWS